MAWYLYCMITDILNEAEQNKLFLINGINSAVFGVKQGVALQVVDSLWKGIRHQVLDIRRIINEPSRLLFDAAKVGNFDLLAEFVKSYPCLIWELDNKRRNKDDGNNILHLAAKLSPADRLELVSGAAFQMKFELLWFEEVRKIALPSYVNMKNSNGETPRELFTKEHASLRKNAESWMKRTSNYCMVVSTLIATGVFSAAFSIPGGINDDTGVPNYLGKRSFMIFAISDVI
ncbi:uncharacterized protein LOC114762070 [Neltuma alba]|uniref:uncharacterized protein LOC114762070 n=1 Tax=Neltuma alba TaxID=207710 RepID=UPI0010A3CBA0|nr:uncharacterized protein LOC114762070 [Prosopis alba]